MDLANGSDIQSEPKVFIAPTGRDESLLCQTCRSLRQPMDEGWKYRVSLFLVLQSDT